MRFLLSKLTKFGRDESGAFAILFGIMAVVLIAAGGSSVDFVAIQQARKTAQLSLDAATLALHPEIYTRNSGWIQARAQAMLEESMTTNDVTVTVGTPDIDVEEGRLKLDVLVERPTFFMRLMGVETMTARMISEATRAKNRLEVAMVLDNSGSMNSYGRMTALKAASTLAVDIISGYEATPDKVYVGIVPFTMFVNVGSSNKNAAWMDTEGRSSISWDNFDDDDNEYTGHDPSNPSDRLDRFALYDAMPNTSWRGCVETRPHDTNLSTSDRLDLNDATPTTADGDTLFVPVFAPDYRDYYSGGVSYLYDYGGSCSSPSLSSRERQERICKYQGTWLSSWSDGPNSTCGDAEILPLTNNMTSVKTSIAAMVADGGTNIHQGALWGWRVLSPTEPFTEGVEYHQQASKIMILMTDGANFHTANGYMNGAYWYTAYGYPYNERLGQRGWSSWALQNEMNRRTEWSCENARDAGITIYTIGLSVSRTSTNGRMLENCASTAGHAFYPANTSELQDTFEDIADQLSDLRLSQ